MLPATANHAQLVNASQFWPLKRFPNDRSVAQRPLEWFPTIDQWHHALSNGSNRSTNAIRSLGFNQRMLRGHSTQVLSSLTGAAKGLSGNPGMRHKSNVSYVNFRDYCQLWRSSACIHDGTTFGLPVLAGGGAAYAEEYVVGGADAGGGMP